MSSKEEVKRYLITRLSEVGRQNVPFRLLAEALADDPNITVTVPRPRWEPGTHGLATVNGARRFGVVRKAFRAANEQRFWYTGADGTGIHVDVPDDFQPVLMLTKADLKALYRRLGYSSTDPQELLAQMVSSRGFSIDE